MGAWLSGELSYLIIVLVGCCPEWAVNFGGGLP